MTSHAPVRFVTAVACALALLVGCQRNSGPFTFSPASNDSGSYSAVNNADCLPDIPFYDQYGRTVSLASLKGKPVLLNFIYTNCATACPLMTARFVLIAKQLRLRLGKDVLMVSITIDPEHDHPAQMLAYARSHNAEYPGWMFLTGKPAEIDRVLAIFKLRRARSADGTISHVPSSFLIGPDGHQDRIYDALDVSPQTVVTDIDRAEKQG